MTATSPTFDFIDFLNMNSNILPPDASFEEKLVQVKDKLGGMSYPMHFLIEALETGNPDSIEDILNLHALTQDLKRLDDQIRSCGDELKETYSRLFLS